MFLQVIDRNIVNGKVNWKSAMPSLGGTKTFRQYTTRYSRYLKPYLTVEIGPWKPEENCSLRAAVWQVKREDGGDIDWMEVARILHCTRTAQQCRERWERLVSAAKRLNQQAAVNLDAVQYVIIVVLISLYIIRATRQ